VVRVSEITKAERTDLASIVKMRARVARAQVEQREAELLADVEEQLSTIYKVDDAAWAEITAEANRTVALADQEIARICRERGVREEFRPGLRVIFYGRGENAAAGRRAELRKLAQARIAAAGRKAKTAIQAGSVDVLTKLYATGLESDQARAFLASIPTAEQLMPPVVVAELEGTHQAGGAS
jgi:hypothetical protein